MITNRLLKSLFLILLLHSFCHGQTLKNIVAKVEGEKVVINYDLTTDDPAHKFGVQLFSSDNNYRTPLALVTGDIGEEIDPGTSRQIIWDAKNELKRFSGNITFEIRATLISADIIFKNPTKGTVLRRGRTYQIDWAGGQTNPNFGVELYRNNVKLESIGNSSGKKSYTWQIPTSKKPGEYQIKLVNDQTKVASTAEFKIGRKIPLALKVAPFVVIGALVGVLSSGGGESPPSNPGADNLPAPPDVPGN